MDANNLQVRWKHHQMGVMDYLRQLLVSEVFVDVTLCCQNKRFKAHRILLSACSSYLQQVLVEHLASDHVTIILPDIHPDDMQWLLDFMYTGSVAVPRCRLPSFLQAAEALHIKILTHMAQLQKATESDSIVCIPACSPALDVKLTNHPKYQKDLLNSNIDINNIKPDNLPEDVKHPVCNDDSKSSTESSKLLNMRQEFKNVTEERKSCMFNCPMDNSPYEPRRTRTPIERDNVSCKSNLKASSLYNGMSKRTELHEGTKEEKNVDGEDCSSEGVEVGNSRCNTNMIHNAVDGNNKSLGRSSENVVLPYLEKPLHNKSSCDSKDVAENLNSNHNPTPPPLANHSGKLVKVPRAERVYSNDRVTPPGEGSSTSEYGFQLSSNTDLHIIPKGNNNQINSNIEYIKDMRVTEDLSLRNQHRNYLPENFEHYPQYLQRLSQWPKPLPSLMPISNNNYQYNGQIPPGLFSKDGIINGIMTHQQMRPTDRKETLPDHLQNMKDIIPGIGPTYQTCGVAAEQHFLKENRCARGVWLSGRDKPMYLNGHKSPSDCRRLSQRLPRLSPIVPPSPWAQHHRPPCAAPVVCPPRGGPLGLNYQPANWMTPKQTSSPVQTFVGHGGGSQQTTSLPTPTGHQQPLGDLTRPPSSTQLPNLVPTAKTCRSPSPHTKYLKKPESNGMGYDQTSIRKRTSESIDMFCKLKERRLQDFYREQLTKLRTGGHESQEKDDEVASDLSTKSSQSPIRSPISHSARSSPSDYQRMISSPLTPSTVSLQQKLKTFAELSSPKLSTCDDRLSCKENIKEEDSTKLTKNCDIDANSIELKTEETGSGSIDDKKLQLPDIKQSGHEQNGEDQDCGQGDDDVQILTGARRTTLTKNDNNNNNGLVDDSAQAAPVAKSHGCEDCGKFFSRRQLLVQHRRIHTGERPYSCADCGRQFTQRGHWSTHQKLHEPARRPEHACPSCGKAFVTRASLKVHLRTHTGEKPFQCGECGKQFSQLRNYKYHRSVHEGTREFAATCPECGKYFNDRGYLSSHMKIHRNRKEYGCQYCGKSFNQRVAYNMHVRIHTGERPHSCPHCNKSFSRKMLLKQHLRIHTGEKPFACSVCGKAFADRSNMTLHMRLHSGIKPYSCQLCSKAFTKKHHLKTHLNYHTGTKPYSCTKCGLRFSQSSNMRTHYKKCTSTGPTNVETPVNKTETTKASGADGNGASSPSSSPGRSDVTMTSPSSSAAVITPPHSDESSCGSTVISRNAIEAQPA